jgi:cellulose synthase (UDP-forming)
MSRPSVALSALPRSTSTPTFSAARTASPEILQAIYDAPAVPRLCVLIPSYKEEMRVLKQTILSAALVEYPERRVVVLVDDPPQASGAERRALKATRELIAELNDSFGAIGRRFEREHRGFLTRAQSGFIDLAAEALFLARLYDEAASWIEELAQHIAEMPSQPAFAHTDRLFIERVVGEPAAAHRAHAAALRASSPDADAIAHDYRRIATLLKVEISGFERKQYGNLSREPNKAMNLNAYIGLLGKRFRIEPRSAGLPLLLECAEPEAGLSIPDADYLLTLDADSLVLSDYAVRLVHVMESDARLAVAQTPYSAVPGAPSTLERIAGATTDSLERYPI